MQHIIENVFFPRNFHPKKDQMLIIKTKRSNMLLQRSNKGQELSNWQNKFGLSTLSEYTITTSL